MNFGRKTKSVADHRPPSIFYDLQTPLIKNFDLHRRFTRFHGFPSIGTFILKLKSLAVS